MKKYTFYLSLTVFCLSFVNDSITSHKPNKQKSQWQKAKSILTSPEAQQVGCLILGISLLIWYKINAHSLKHALEQEEQQEQQEPQKQVQETSVEHGKELVEVFEPVWKHDLHKLGVRYCWGCPKRYTKLTMGCHLTIKASNGQEDKQLQKMYNDLNDFNAYKKSQNQIPWEVNFKKGNGKEEHVELSFLIPKEHINPLYKNVYFIE